MLDVAVAFTPVGTVTVAVAADVVACTQLVAVEPAELTAATSNEYVVPAERLLTVNEVAPEPSEPRSTAWPFSSS